MSILSDIIESGSIEGLADHLFPGQKWRAGETPVRCPSAGHADENASATADRSKGVWKCHGCDAGGDFVDLVMERRGLQSFADVARVLREDGFLPQASRNVGRSGARDDVSDQKRGVVSQKAPKGDTPSWPPSEEVLSALGWKHVPGTGVAAPVYDGDLQVSAVKWKNPGGRPPYRLADTKAGRRDSGLILDPRVLTSQKGRVVLLCEGESDMAAAKSAALREGLDVLLASGSNGAKNSPPKGSAAALRGFRVVPCFDGDIPGQEGMRIAVERFTEASVPAMPLILFDEIAEKKGRDLRDLLESGVTLASIMERAEALFREPEAPTMPWTGDPAPFSSLEEMEALDLARMAPHEVSFFAMSVAEALQVHPAQVFACIPPILGAAAGGAWGVTEAGEDGEGYREKCLARWAIVGADSGSRKSGTVNALAGPIMEWQSEQAEAIRSRSAEIAQERDELKDSLTDVRRRFQAAAEDDEEEVRIEWLDILQRQEELERQAEFVPILEQNTTVEAFIQESMISGRYKSIIAHEGREFGKILLGTYAGKTQEAQVLAFYDGDQASYSRKTSGAQWSDRVVASVLLAVQPDVLEELTQSNSLNQSGFLARCSVTSIPKRTVPRDVEKAPIVNAEAKRVWGMAIRRLLDFQTLPEETDATVGDLTARPKVSWVTMTPEGRRAHFAYKARIEAQSVGEEDTAVSGLLDKQAMAALRLAALYHLLAEAAYVEMGETFGVNVAPMDVGVIVAAQEAQDWFLRETLRAVHESSDVVTEQRRVREVVLWVQSVWNEEERPVWTGAQIQAVLGATVQETENVLRNLVRLGYARTDDSREWRDRVLRYEFHPSTPEMLVPESDVEERTRQLKAAGRWTVGAKRSEVERLLSEGVLSFREISEVTGASKSAVGRLAKKVTNRN